MATPSYIPASDAAFDTWLTNFSAKLTADPTTYGLTAPDAVIVAGVTTAWSAAYALASAPATRTSVTIQDKTNARNTATATVRPYAVQISLNAGVTDANKTAIGVTVAKTVPTPVPPPLTWPTLTLNSASPKVMNIAYRDSATPTSKSKPFGVTGCQVFVGVGVTPAISPSACAFFAQWTKSPAVANFDASQEGMKATFFARWMTTSGPGGVAQFGPWSPPVTFTII